MSRMQTRKLSGIRPDAAHLSSRENSRGNGDVRILPVSLAPNVRRVVSLPFHLADPVQIEAVFRCVEQLPDREIHKLLKKLYERFGDRHGRLEADLEDNFRTASESVQRSARLARERRQLIGAYCTMEYSIEGAALFNPSIVPHPDQGEAPAGGLRFIMSLRAVGEGHMSSTVFQTGTISPSQGFSLDMPGEYTARTRIRTDQNYETAMCRRKLTEMGADGPGVHAVLERVGATFTLKDIEYAVMQERRRHADDPRFDEGVASLLWLVNANYELKLGENERVGDLVIFPRSDSERRGIEDMRLVRFVDEDKSVRYFGSYTAYDGHHILPMLMETKDFRILRMHTLNGACAQNKGMALFPRRIKGHYAMCSRIDGRRLFLMLSDMVHFWETATVLAEPRHPWEMRLMGNCGSPIETDEGWLLFTHGVGPMRRYSIGAMLLDRDDPLKVRGRLKLPLLEPRDQDREGYTPNVVYSCGALVHEDTVYMPFAVSDSSTRVATVPLAVVLERLLRDGP